MIGVLGSRGELRARTETARVGEVVALVSLERYLLVSLMTNFRESELSEKRKECSP